VLSKKDQVRKVRTNQKRKSSEWNKKFHSFIWELNNGKCQVCDERLIQDFHHEPAGYSKDDRLQVGICRECHHVRHFATNINGSQYTDSALMRMKSTIKKVSASVAIKNKIEFKDTVKNEAF